MASSGGKTTFAKYACQIFCLTSQKISYASPCGPYRQYDLRDNSKHSDVLIDLTEFCGQLVEAKCLAVNPRDNNYLAVGANGPFVRLYDIRMIHNYRLSCVKNRTLKYMRLLVRFFFNPCYFCVVCFFLRMQEICEPKHISSCAHIL